MYVYFDAYFVFTISSDVFITSQESIYVYIT